MHILIGIIVLLHGLVHIWYIILSQGWVEFDAKMGWTGKSWLLTGLLGNEITRLLGAIFYSLACVTFVVAGVGLMLNRDWSRIWMIAASTISIITIFAFWDGSLNMPVEKGLLGLLINVCILVAIFLFNWLA
jgi:hypothetical protein